MDRNMTETTARVHAFVGVPFHYQFSRELSLGLNLCLKTLSDTILTIASETSPGETPLWNRIVAELEAATPAEFLLLVKEPALLFSAGAIPALVAVLDQNPDYKAVIPGDIRDHARPGEVPYLSLRGFEAFTARLANQRPDQIPYDDRAPPCALIRTSALQDLELPSEPIHVIERIAERTVIALTAHVHSFCDYYDHDRQQLLTLIPEDVHSLLDIGCAHGYFGKAVKAARNCRVVGIEMNPTEGRRAQQHLDRVLIGDALAVSPEERFDCVSCLDVIEHLVEPSLLLERIGRDFLTAQGYLLLSIPNVSHWSTVADLLAGRWDYMPAGLLCNTHLRFFTLSSIRGLLAEHGFDMLRVHPETVPMPEAIRGAVSTLQSPGMDIDVAGLNALSYDILARKR